LLFTTLRSCKVAKIKRYRIFTIDNMLWNHRIRGSVNVQYMLFCSHHCMPHKTIILDTRFYSGTLKKVAVIEWRAETKWTLIPYNSTLQAVSYKNNAPLADSWSSLSSVFNQFLEISQTALNAKQHFLHSSCVYLPKTKLFSLVDFLGGDTGWGTGSNVESRKTIKK
jgi:hypothetical protein